MVFHAKRNNKKPRVTILASGETDFKTKAITKHKGYYSMIRGSIQDKDIICINMHTPRVPKYMKQTFTDMKGETDNNTITKGDFRTSLFPCGSVAKNLPANAGDMSLILCSCLGNVMDRGAWQTIAHGGTKESDTP